MSASLSDSPLPRSIRFRSPRCVRSHESFSFARDCRVGGDSSLRVFRWLTLHQLVINVHNPSELPSAGPESLKFLQIHYWGGIVRTLRNHGCRVIVARVPTAGSVQNRAAFLKKLIDERIRGGSVNLIGHSMVSFSFTYFFFFPGATMPYLVYVWYRQITPSWGSIFIIIREASTADTCSHTCWTARLNPRV
jgi:hypothetical protein